MLMANDSLIFSLIKNYKYLDKINLVIRSDLSFEDFIKLEIRIGKILTAERVEGSDKLLKLQVDFGL
jgi:tRNA-binding EMAP/Myf-like protein